MTEANFEGDSSDDRSPGLLVTIAELAETRGYARQVMYRKVDKLAEQGLIEIHTGERGVKLVSPAEFDRAIGDVADLGREAGASTRRGGDDGGESNSAAYTREQARNMAYRADLSRLELEERTGKLVRVDELRPILATAAAVAVKAIDRLSQETDQLRAICARDETGREVERALKAIAHKMRTEVADAIKSAVSAAPTGQGGGAEVAA